MKTNKDSKFPRWLNEGKSPRNNSGGEFMDITGRKKEKKNLLYSNDEDFQHFNDNEWVKQWVNAEINTRKWEYFRLKKL